MHQLFLMLKLIHIQGQNLSEWLTREYPKIGALCTEPNNSVFSFGDMRESTSGEGITVSR